MEILWKEKNVLTADETEYRIFITKNNKIYYLQLKTMIRRVNMKIRPLGERVLIKQTKQEETTKSGIVLPDTASKEKPIIGEVTAIGEAIKEIKIGDKVIYEKYAGTEVKDNDDVYLLLEVKNVLAVVE